MALGSRTGSCTSEIESVPAQLVGAAEMSAAFAFVVCGCDCDYISGDRVDAEFIFPQQWDVALSFPPTKGREGNMGTTGITRAQNPAMANRDGIHARGETQLR